MMQLNVLHINLIKLITFQGYPNFKRKNGFIDLALHSNDCKVYKSVLLKDIKTFLCYQIKSLFINITWIVQSYRSTVVYRNPAKPQMFNRRQIK